MKIKGLLLFLSICLLTNLTYASDIEDILKKEKQRIKTESIKDIKETEKTTQNKEIIKNIEDDAKNNKVASESNIAVIDDIEETTDAYVADLNEYQDMTISDLIAEEIIKLNETKYDYSSFIKLLNIDKNTNFIVNDGEIILNSGSDINYINQYITKKDFIVFSKYSKKNNSINVKVLKDNNTTGTLSIKDINGNNISTNIKNNNIIDEEYTQNGVIKRKVLENNNIISTNSNINISSKSNIDKEIDIITIKTITGKKGNNNNSFGKDLYGNDIENNVNAWVGEDNGNLNEESLNNFITNVNENIDKENSGIINVSIDNKYLQLNDSNIKIVLMDHSYSLYNMFVYYRNDYNEKMYLPYGKYYVNEVVNLNSKIQDLTTNLTEFRITKNEPVELIITKKIDNINETIKNVEVSTESEIKVEIEVKKPNLFIFILKVIFIIGLLIGIGFIVKIFIFDKLNNDNE